MFFSSRGPFGFVYLYLKGSTSPTDVSLPLCPDPGIYVWNSLLIYLWASSSPCILLFFSHSWSWYCLLLNYISITLRHAHNLSLMNSSPKMKIMSFQTCVFFFHETTGDVSESERMGGWIPCSNWKWHHLDQQIILGNKLQIQAFIYRSQETDSGRFDNKLSN